MTEVKPSMTDARLADFLRNVAQAIEASNGKFTPNENTAQALREASRRIRRAPANAGVTPEGWVDVMTERRRQIEAEGWTEGHDDEHTKGEMARAAATYALGAAVDSPDRAVIDQFGREGAPYYVHSMWPEGWAREWFKPKSRRRDLVKAAALILAEIERLDRAMLAARPAPPVEG